MNHPNILDSAADLRALFARTRTIAVLGIKTEAQSSQAAFYVPQYLQAAGFDVIPVPVYYPEANRILGQPVYRNLSAIPGAVDLVNVFRRPADIPAHLDDMLEKNSGKPEVVGELAKAYLRLAEVESKGSGLLKGDRGAAIQSARKAYELTLKLASGGIPTGQD